MRRETSALSTSITDCGVVSSDPSILRLYLGLLGTVTSEAVLSSRLFFRLHNLPETQACSALSDGTRPLVGSSEQRIHCASVEALLYITTGSFDKTLLPTFTTQASCYKHCVSGTALASDGDFCLWSLTVVENIPISAPPQLSSTNTHDCLV